MEYRIILAIAIFIIIVGFNDLKDHIREYYEEKRWRDIWRKS